MDACVDARIVRLFLQIAVVIQSFADLLLQLTELRLVVRLHGGLVPQRVVIESVYLGGLGCGLDRIDTRDFCVPLTGARLFYCLVHDFLMLLEYFID